MIVLLSYSYNLKSVVAHRCPASSPSPFASVMNWKLPSAPLNRCIFLKHNCTKILQWVASLQPHWKDVLFKLVSVTDISMNQINNMKAYESLGPLHMVKYYGKNNLTFSERNILQIWGKIPLSSLAQGTMLYILCVIQDVIKQVELKLPVIGEQNFELCYITYILCVVQPLLYGLKCGVYDVLYYMSTNWLYKS